MSMKLYKEQNVQNIADAIRDRNGEETTYKIRDMASAIRELPSVEMYEKLLENQVTNVATGNSVYLENSADMPFKKLEVQGNTEQESYSGKNLFNPNQEYRQGTYKYFQFTEQEDKAYTLSVKVKKGKTIPSELYFGFTTTGDYSEYNKVIWIIENGVLNRNSNINLIEGEYAKYISIYPRNINVSEYFDIQLEQGSTATAYEPYVGGTASPNPEYPQQVKCVGQDVNLLNVNEFVLGDLANETGAEVENLNKTHYRTPFIKVEPNTNYVFKTNHIWSNNTRIVKLLEYGAGKDFLMRNPKSVAANEISFSTSNNTEYFRLCIYDADKITDIYSEKYQLSKGTTSTQFRSYGQGSASVKVQNRNLFNPVPVYINYNVNSDGFGPSTNYATTGKIKVGNATKINYGLISGFTNVGDNGLRTGFFKKDGTFISRNNLIPTTSIKEEQIPNDTDYIMIGAFNSVNNGLWLEANKVFIGFDNDTSYIEHQEQNFTIPVQQEMCAIGDVKDRFTKIAGKWYEEHNVGKVVLDGSDDKNWNKLQTLTNTITYQSSVLSNVKLNIANELKYKSNRFIGNNNYSLDSNHFYVTNAGAVCIFINKNVLTGETTNDFKQWLSEHKPEVYYILATPQLIECTEEQTQILNKLQEALTYQGGTHVSATSENANPLLDIEYFVDIRPATMLLNEEKTSNFKLEEEEE